MTALGIVYFIQPGNSPVVKIGWTSNYASRLNVLQTHNPDPLRLLRAIEGTRAGEKDLHVKFSRHRRHGEWYDLAPEIASFITQSAKGHVDPIEAEGRRLLSGIFAADRMIGQLT